VIRLRPASIEDIERLITLSQYLSAYYPPESQIEQAAINFFSQPLYSIVAESSDRIVGFGYVHFHRKPRGGIIGMIEDVVVDPDFRHRGVGSLIVKELLENCWSSGCYKVSLFCSSENIDFYKKLGFLKVDQYMKKLA
jgi:N-acetylglutamate synthase-like GNAT family acetyltransferase